MTLDEFVAQMKARVDEFAASHEQEPDAEYERWSETFLIWEEEKHNVAKQPDSRVCDACSGSGSCSDCVGEGCEECEESGDCPVCDGAGVLED